MVLFASKDAPERADYRYENVAGGKVGYHKDARPSINAKHIDGPLLYLRNGELHWLTPWERFMFWIGRTDAETLEKKHRPHLSQ